MPILNLEEARIFIRKILKGESGRVLPTPYCRNRMLVRQVFMEDINRVLFWGSVEIGTHEGDVEGNIFRVIGQDCDDDPLTLVIRIIPSKELIEVITVFGEIHGRT